MSHLPPSSQICITVMSLNSTSCLSVAMALTNKGNQHLKIKYVVERGFQ